LVKVFISSIKSGIYWGTLLLLSVASASLVNAVEFYSNNNVWDDNAGYYGGALFISS